MADSAAVMVGDAPASVFQSDLPIETKIERARTELLDLSARNRLLNIPRSSKSAKIVEIVDEKSSEIFRMCEGKTDWLWRWIYAPPSAPGLVSPPVSVWVRRRP